MLAIRAVENASAVGRTLCAWRVVWQGCGRTMWLEWVVVVGSQAALFAAGWAFLRFNLYNDFEEQNPVVQVRNDTSPSHSSPMHHRSAQLLNNDSHHRLIRHSPCATASHCVPPVHPSIAMPATVAASQLATVAMWRCLPLTHCWVAMSASTSSQPCSPPIQVLFSLVFALSSNLIELVIFEVTGALSYRWLAAAWRRLADPPQTFSDVPQR